MKMYVGVTNDSWFQYHAIHKPDEVNFWRPGGESRFAALDEGEPFLFKLRYPQNFIVGGGIFLSYTRLPISMAWRIFEEKNGCSDLPALRRLILANKSQRDHPGIDPFIGCILLGIPFFFPREMWLPAPQDWRPSIQQGKAYDLSSFIGKEIWNEVLDRMGQIPDYFELEPEIRKEGPLYVVEGRRGQAAFRSSVLEAYKRRCAITQERTMPALEASHIKPYKTSGPNRVSNGILLRADLHQIFDEGYITVRQDYHIEVSKRIKAEYENGKEYYQFNGLLLPNLPDNHLERPDKRFIEWHNQHVYRG